jgi:hypothetical protein
MTTPSDRPRRLLRTTDEIWAYGPAEPCPHGVASQTDCDHCRLTPEERALVIRLLFPGLRRRAAE